MAGNGLLDFFKTPEGQGLLAAGFGAAAGARPGQPWNTLGRGGLAGLAGYSNAVDRQTQEAERAEILKDREFNRNYRQVQMDSINTDLARKKAEQEWRAGLPAAVQATQATYGAGDEGPTKTPGNPNALRDYSMLPNSPFADKILERQLFPSAGDYKVVGDALLNIGPDGKVLPVYQAPQKPEAAPSSVREYQYGQENPAFNAWLLSNKKAGANSVHVDARNFNTQESEQSKSYGKHLGEVRGTIQQAGYDAPGKLAQLERMEQLLTGVGGGNVAPTIAQIGSVANSLGIKLDPKLGAKEASEALAREMAASMRQPGTGPMTDKDFDNFLKRVPDLSKSPEGRSEITKTMRAALERDIRAAQFSREYAAKNGGVIDDNFFGALSDFYSKNPVVTPNMPSNNARGQSFSDPGKERRYQEWLKKQGGAR